MNKTLAVLGSSTIWTVIVTVVLNAVPAFREFIPANVLPFVDILLVALASYFHIGSVDRAYEAAGDPTIARGAEGLKRSY